MFFSRAEDFYLNEGENGLHPKLFPLIKLCRSYRGYLAKRLSTGHQEPKEGCNLVCLCYVF